MKDVSFINFKEWIFDLLKPNFIENKLEEVNSVPDNLDLVEHGVIDSLEFLSLILDINSAYDIKIDLSDASDDHYASITTLYEQAKKSTTRHSEYEFSRNEYHRLLEQIGIRKNDIVLIHSGIHKFGLVEGGVSEILLGIQSVIGNRGTILISTANVSEFIHNQFDVQETPAEGNLGVLSEYVRCQEGSVRSNNPFESLCGLGYYSKDICSGTNQYTYGMDSPWRRALKCGAKLLMLGVGFYYAAIVHVAEVECKVYYRDWKKFKGTIVENGESKEMEYYLFARDLSLECDYARITSVDGFDNGTNCMKTKLGGNIYHTDLTHVYDLYVQTLEKKPGYFVDLEKRRIRN